MKERNKKFISPSKRHEYNKLEAHHNDDDDNRKIERTKIKIMSLSNKTNATKQAQADIKQHH